MTCSAALKLWFLFPICDRYISILTYPRHKDGARLYSLVCVMHTEISLLPPTRPWSLPLPLRFTDGWSRAGRPLGSSPCPVRTLPALSSTLHLALSCQRSRLLHSACSVACHRAMLCRGTALRLTFSKIKWGDEKETGHSHILGSCT